MKRAKWLIESCTWRSGNPTQVEVEYGSMSETALIELATALLNEARQQRRIREARARLNKEAS